MKKQKFKEILTFLKRSNKLKSVQRYSASLSKNGDTTAEHSWQLTFMVFVIATECNLKINLSRAMALALVHDLAESVTGDIDAYEQIVKGEKLVQDKYEKERLAMKAITKNLSFGKEILNLWNEYGDHKTLEAKFVAALDGIEAYIHIAERGVRAYIPKKFHGYYADGAVSAFDQAAHSVPEIKDLLNLVKKDLKTQFEKVGVKYVAQPHRF